MYPGKHEWKNESIEKSPGRIRWGFLIRKIQTMRTESQLFEKIRKIKALFERARTEGEKQAAEAALKRMQEKLASLQKSDTSIEMKFTLGNPWSRRLFVALCRRYSLRPYRYSGQRYTTVMMRVPQSFVNEILWPEFLELAQVLVSYLNSITNRIISEEVFGVVEEAEEASEAIKKLLVWITLSLFVEITSIILPPTRGRGWLGFSSPCVQSVRGWHPPALALLQSRRRWLVVWRGFETSAVGSRFIA